MIDAHAVYKKAILDADENATVIIKRTLGSPAKALKNGWTDQILEKEALDAGYGSLKHYISGEANKRFIYEGKDTQGFGWAGQGAAGIHDMPSANTLIQSMIHEAEAIQLKWGNVR